MLLFEIDNGSKTKNSLPTDLQSFIEPEGGFVQF